MTLERCSRLSAQPPGSASRTAAMPSRSNVQIVSEPDDVHGLAPGAFRASTRICREQCAGLPRTRGSTPFAQAERVSKQ
jgi:hypothetical protein